MSEQTSLECVPNFDAQQIEDLAFEFHNVYQAEARRQGDVRHADLYPNLPENVKEFDRALARYVILLLRLERSRLIQEGEAPKAATLRSVLRQLEELSDKWPDAEIKPKHLAPVIAEAKAALGEKDA